MSPYAFWFIFAKYPIYFNYPIFSTKTQGYFSYFFQIIQISQDFSKILWYNQWNRLKKFKIGNKRNPKKASVFMKMNIDRISLIAAGTVLAVLLLFLSITYLQNRTSVPLEQGTRAKKAETVQEPPRRLTKEEREEKLLEREAERMGQSTDELKNAAKAPLSIAEKEAQRIESLSNDEARGELVRRKRQLSKMSESKVSDIVDLVSPEKPKRETSVKREVQIEDFDADTAQIDDCERTQNEDGTFRYTATLVDAKGNSIRVEMDQKEGERTYQTMQMIRSNPLMEMIYRRTVMPLLDQKTEKNETNRKTDAPQITEENHE